ncbi:MAG: DNA polymerase III subunit delta' [Desulfobacterota bacterium]|nr:DNA polymerase III subunit delta' [Thermodesulfobacteriota bacterium]
MPFSEIFGHEQAISLLRQMIRSATIPHAFIFYGASGIGKKTSAFAFAKALNCPNMLDDFCSICTACCKIEQRVHPDILYLEPFENKNTIGIDQLREMQEQIAYRPFEGMWKVVIIDNADRLQTEAANSLLKTLEEPPDNTVIVLIATSIAGMLPTILSRCQQIRFLPLTSETIVDYLCSRVDACPEDATIIAQYAHGSIERALMLFDEEFINQRNKFIAMLSQETVLQPGASNDLIGKISKERQEAFALLDLLELWYRDLLLIKFGMGESKLLYNRDHINSLLKAEQHETVAGIIAKIRRIHTVQNTWNTNPDIQLALESILLQREVIHHAVAI